MFISSSSSLLMVETGRREDLKLFTSLKIKEARKGVGFVCSSKVSEDASD